MFQINFNYNFLDFKSETPGKLKVHMWLAAHFCWIAPT